MKALGYVLAVLLCISSSVGAHAQLHWFAIDIGPGAPRVEDDTSGHPTMTLFYVPTQVTFSRIYFNISTADPDTSHYYDIGIGSCPSFDCSQGNVQITIVCNLGAQNGDGINLTTTGPQSYHCAQSTPVTLNPGVYALLGAGNANLVHCYGQAGSASAVTFVSHLGLTINGSLTNSATGLSITRSGAKSPGNGCMISLH
jgi:hypothetical protein